MLWFCTFHRTISCLHVDFECFKLALWPTLRQKFMNFWSFLTRPSDKHDEKIRKLLFDPQAGPNPRFCRESHDFLTFQSDSEDDYRTCCRNVSHCQQQQSYSGLRSPGRSNSTYQFKNVNVNCCWISWIIIDSPHVNAENFKLYNAFSKRLLDAFVRHLSAICSSNATKWVFWFKYGFYRQNPAC